MARAQKADARAAVERTSSKSSCDDIDDLRWLEPRRSIGARFAAILLPGEVPAGFCISVVLRKPWAVDTNSTVGPVKVRI